MTVMQRWLLNGKNLITYLKDMTVGNPRNVSMDWYNDDDSVTTYTNPNLPKVLEQVAGNFKGYLYKTIYIDAVNGDDANSGLSTSSPVKTFGRALELKAVTGGYTYIKLLSDITLKASEKTYIHLSKVIVDSTDTNTKTITFDVDVNTACLYVKSSSSFLTTPNIVLKTKNTTGSTNLVVAISVDEDAYVQTSNSKLDIGDNTALFNVRGSKIRVYFSGNNHTIGNNAFLIKVSYTADLQFFYGDGKINGDTITTSLLSNYINGIIRDGDSGNPINVLANVNLSS